MVRPEVKKRRQKEAIAANQSRKARKKLEKVVLHKKLKVDRSAILAKLKSCQLKPEQLAQLHSTSSMQTKGLKRFLSEGSSANDKKLNDIQRAEQCLDASHLVRKRRKKIRRSNSESKSSSSEDTDDVSTDTEVYYDSSDERTKQDIGESREKKDPAHLPTNETSQGNASIKTEAPPPKVDRVKREPKYMSEPTKVDATPKQPAIFVEVIRRPEIQKSRLDLPIIGEEQRIVESIRYNDVVIVSGETGSGKTTQIPQFLYEAGYALNDRLIGVTEPRRVAAIAMSERVGKELNLTNGEVSYQIRFAGNVTNRTRIKFMTDGVLLRECQQDFLLSKYSVIIIDEAHERSVFSDILIGLLSRIVPLRKKRDDPLKLVIMSATLRVTDFTKNTFLFKIPPPLIKIDARQYPVTVQFAKRTPANYLQAAYRKVCSVHSRMPRGGILVFVTSQMDVRVLCRKLRQKFPAHKDSFKSVCDKSASKKNSTKPNQGPSQNQMNSIKYTMDNLKEDISRESDEDDIGHEEDGNFMKASLAGPDWSETESDSDDEEGIVKSTNTPLYCLGLFAMLPIEKQKKVFEEPPSGARLCVVATNVAETSITIPNIRYVIDTGMEKTKVYDLITGVSRFVTTWTNKSSAEQRLGRAGRMGPGSCFRLYSSAVYTNDFPDHAQPKILQRPVEDVLLQMKTMNIDNVVNFPFPTRPSIDALVAAEKKLILLGALDDSKAKVARYKEISKTEFSSRPTPLGKAMSNFAVSARCSKMIVLSPPEVLSYVISLVSALTVREMFLEGNKWKELRKKWSGHGESKLLGDFAIMIRAIMVADSSGCEKKQCLENGLRMKAMLEIDKLRRQLTHEINSNLNYPASDEGMTVKKPKDSYCTILRQLLLSSHLDHVARKLPDGYITEKDPEDPNKTIKSKLKNAYECMEAKEPVYISQDSVLKGEHPEFIIYKELYRGDKRLYMRDVAVVKPEWMPYYASRLCNFSDSKETTTKQVIYDKTLDQIMCIRETTYGSMNWPLGSIYVPMNLVDSTIETYKYFAYFLLDGEIIDWFKKHKEKLLSPPYIMTKPWSKLQPRTSLILHSLVAHNIRSKGELTKAWKNDSQFLKREYLAWLPESVHGDITQQWDQLASYQ